MTAYADCPDARWMFEWFTARAYDARDEAGDTTIYKSLYEPHLFSAGEMSLLWYLTFYAKVSGDL